MIYTEVAQYSRAILPEHRGNALIEALPEKISDLELAKKLAYYPVAPGSEVHHSPNIRLDYLINLDKLRQPQIIYLEVFRAVESAIKAGYSSKNPLSPTTMNFLHYSNEDRPNIEPRTGFFKPKGCGITIIGESGIGKTSMLEQILGVYPDVIEHKKYGEHQLSLSQIVWIKVDCPDDSSVKGLCYRILDELDKKIGKGTTKPQNTIAMLIRQIEAKMKSCFLGLLVIDEMQNLNIAKSGGADRLLGFLHNLMNNLGIPILLCANPPFDKLLSKSLKSARRAESGGYFNLELLKNTEEEWGLFVDELWDLQWTNVKTPLSKKLSDKLYMLSVGNMDLAVRIFKASQRIIIGSLDEVITEPVLEKGANVAIRASKKSTDEIRISITDNPLKRKKRQIDNSVQQVIPKKPLSSKVNIGHQGNFFTIEGDLSRPQHPEFSEILTLLQKDENILGRIKDPDLLQRASEGSSIKTNLKQAGILCEDPLELFK